MEKRTPREAREVQFFFFHFVPQSDFLFTIFSCFCFSVQLVFIEIELHRSKKSYDSDLSTIDTGNREKEKLLAIP